MWIAFQRLIAWIARTDASGLSAVGTAGVPFGSWHGDHWQNLLCSPMDARHYVMEDWTVMPEPESETPSASQRRR
jgi:hypothetical protein